MAKSKYTAAQKRAYHSGQAYCYARNGKAIKYKNPNNWSSFTAGYASVQEKVQRAPRAKWAKK